MPSACTAAQKNDRQWSHAELIAIEKKLAGDDYQDIFQIEPVGELEKTLSDQQ